MRSTISLAGIALMFIAGLAAAQDQKTAEPSGELLYTTYCIGCHTTQVHWREKTLATDLASLKFQVRRWLLNAGLGVSENDVAALAGYLNALYYKFPAADTKRSGETGATGPLTARRKSAIGQSYFE